jgi:hypothetical protein
VAIKLRASKLGNQAVTWIASGNVTIAGTLDLSGATPATVNTGVGSDPAAARVLAEPGPGGYTGGLGAFGGVAPQPGAGPGGGPAGVLDAGGTACYGASGAFILNGITWANTGTPYGSYMAVPLYGGSGGGGGWDNSGGQLVGGMGGAGGGALRISSSTQIIVTGTIDANGGSAGQTGGSIAGCWGGPGAGGTIHLVAPTISGIGTLEACAGNYPGRYDAAPCNGLIRFGTNTNNFTGSASPNPVVTALYLPPPNATLPVPSLSITSVNGNAVPAEAAGSYLSPDVTIAATSAVNVILTGANIPLTAPVTLRVTAETGGDTTISCTSNQGSTTASSTWTCSATFPYAISIAGARATW